MKIATYNVNGVNGRLPVLLRWLSETKPDVVCLQELKAPQEKFPEQAIADAGYQAIWHGQKSWNGVAILSRMGKPEELRRVLPGDPEDSHSRYIEAVVDGIVISCLYLPNGNPAPGEKFDYKLRWFDRLTVHAASLLASGKPVVLTGDYNVMPTDLDVYKPEKWVDDALFRPEVRAAFAKLVAQGWTDAVRHLHPDEKIYTFWIISGMRMAAMRGCGSIIFCCRRRWRGGCAPRAWIAKFAGGRRRVIMHRCGWSWRRGRFVAAEFVSARPSFSG